MPTKKSSLYPLHPTGTRILIPAPPSTTLANADRWTVYLSSLLVVGSFVWIPVSSYHLYQKWKQIPNEQRYKKRWYGTMLLSIVVLAITGPHRSEKVGEFFKVRKWKLWRSWMKYVAYEVITDVDFAKYASTRKRSTTTTSSPLSFVDVKQDPTITAIIPHGLVPFSVAFSALPEVAQTAFGAFRPVVATATKFFPFVNMWLSWLDKVDASRPAVEKALAQKTRIGLSPGGISEMFEGYPKPPNSHPHDECALLASRKGFVRMAIQHQIPIVPVYCFGASDMLRRLNFPILEKLSKLWKISICLFYGVGGLPIPFRQRLLYVMGTPIFPPVWKEEDGLGLDEKVDDMHGEFCEELIRIFDKYKECYGWEDKRLQIT